MELLNEKSIISNVKLDLDITDNLQNDLLEMLLNRIVGHFKSEYGISEINGKYAFIFEDCLIKRFNRRGAEGTRAESIEGHSVTYYENENEFKPYDDMLQRELGESGQAKQGRLLIL